LEKTAALRYGSAVPKKGLIPPEVVQVLYTMDRCPEHGYVVLPCFGYRACCLLAAVEGAQKEPERAQEILAAALAERDGSGKLPKLWRKR